MTEPQVWALLSETLGRLEQKLDAALSSFSGKLEGKADRADILRLDEARESTRIATEKRLAALENASARSEGAGSFLAKIWTACSASAALGYLVVYVLHTH